MLIIGCDSHTRRMAASYFRKTPLGRRWRSFPGDTESSSLSISRYVRRQALREEFTE